MPRLYYALFRGRVVRTDDGAFVLYLGATAEYHGRNIGEAKTIAPDLRNFFLVLDEKQRFFVLFREILTGLFTGLLGRFLDGTRKVEKIDFWIFSRKIEKSHFLGFFGIFRNFFWIFFPEKYKKAKILVKIRGIFFFV